MNSLALPDYGRMVSTRNLSAGFGEKTVFENIYLDFVEHKTTIMLGPGGSGKSVIGRLLAQAPMPDNFWMRGNIYWGGLKLVSMPQMIETDATFTQLLQQKRPRIKRVAHYAAELLIDCPEAWLRLEPWLDTPLTQCPVPLAKLLYLMFMALDPEAECLLLDEPEVEAYQGTYYWLLLLLQRLKTTKTLIIITHHIALTRSLADYVILFAYGSIIEQGPCQSFFEAPVHNYTKNIIKMGC